MGCGASRSTSSPVIDGHLHRSPVRREDTMEKKEVKKVRIDDSKQQATGATASGTSPPKLLQRKPTPFSLPLPKDSEKTPRSIPSSISETESVDSDEIATITTTLEKTKVIGGTESEIEFFKNLDKKIEAGKDYVPEEDTDVKKQ